ncbi:NSFL1 cofactor p47-like [Diorhabda sublineata]|uniref:NSFL1 cofactor p47-like n=1 Tax=Diorhabda sublineata TaxID=1163346 RepID=UPI0024E0FBF9|nr:NSFL1 cofactor p47-like [Diorhabda sublineata]XP_056646169.1 NSFL1 cofactor p47-like [Diorhabda sublineata]
MSEENEKITQFMSITDATEDRAIFFLESANWQLEVAMARYYENDGEDGNVEEVPPITESPKSPVSIQKKPKPKVKIASNVTTISVINSSSDEDDEEGQAYYAGGSENSGQQVLGPPKKKDFVADMFKSVQKHGVEIVEPRASTSNTRAFRGTGYKLGQEDNDTEVVQGIPEPTAPSEVALRLWKNGFSVNDGTLRLYTDPANKEFLEDIRKGKIPKELRKGTSEIHLAMEDRRTEVYKPPKTSNAFQGQGYTLGSPTPTVVGTCSDEDKTNYEVKAREQLKLDNSKPTTSLQIRLADGSRLVAQFNHEHTVAEIRAYIQVARPEYQNQPFNLMSSYPPKILDDTQTIADAALLNSAIMQKLI